MAMEDQEVEDNNMDYLSGFGKAMDAPIGQLGGVSGTAAESAWGGGEATGAAPSARYTRDERIIPNDLKPRSAGYYNWLYPGEDQGGGGPSPGGPPGEDDPLRKLLAMLFKQQQQKRPDYSQLFMSPTPTPIGGDTFSNQPSYGFGNINPYA
jgi:hypothetical protein